MRSIPSLRCFSNVAFETAPMFVWLTTALSRPFKEDGKNKINEAFQNEIIGLKFLFWCVLPVGDKTPTYLLTYLLENGLVLGQNTFWKWKFFYEKANCCSVLILFCIIITDYFSQGLSDQSLPLRQGLLTQLINSLGHILSLSPLLFFIGEALVVSVFFSSISYMNWSDVLLS